MTDIKNWEMWNGPEFCRGSYQFASVTDGKLPEGAVRAGIDKDGTFLYVGRADHEGDILPAKVSCEASKPDYFFCYVSFEGKEIKKYTFEVMISKDTAWMNGSVGEVPPQAIVVGRTSAGEDLFYGRAFFKHTITPGKVHRSQKCLYVPYSDEEFKVNDYEVLILQ